MVAPTSSSFGNGEAVKPSLARRKTQRSRAIVRSRGVRVIVADDQTLVRSGICELVKRLPGVTVVAEAADGSEALRLIGPRKANLILIDVQMAGMNGFEATVLAKQEFPDVKVILLSDYANDQLLARVVRSGADGFVLKSTPVAELHRIISAVAESIVRARKGTRQSSANGRERVTNYRPLKLTNRQREVLRLIGEGRSTKEIATLLRVSVNTVKSHRLKLMERLNVHEITGAVRHAVQLGLINH